ncbi:MAG: TlpA family protein disulfide reductase [Bacteroidales bacterium]|nr:TlpA family protein disulfide reductase [Bacteroidales bacterium]
MIDFLHILPATIRRFRLKVATYGVAIMLLGGGILSGCSREKAEVSLQFPEEFNGKNVELISFNDSTVIASAPIAEGGSAFTLLSSDSLAMPVLAQIVVDGRVKGYYVIEEGQASWKSGDAVAKGTSLNERFASLMQSLDEAEEAENFDQLTALAEKNYNENKENLFGPYFGVEWLKWADPLKVDSLLKDAPADFKDSRRAQRYIQFARLRAKTAPGQPIADFEGADVEGKRIKFSDYIQPGKYTLVDFMASWCPYCIKDMPKIKEIQSRYKDNGLEIVSVAVRDEPSATAMAVEKHGIDWLVVYDAQKRPYDLYGFSGIPHYMLVGPDGRIVARSMKLEEIESKIPVE